MCSITEVVCMWCVCVYRKIISHGDVRIKTVSIILIVLTV